MIGHVRLTYDEAGHCMSRLARVEQACRREEVKGAGGLGEQNYILERRPEVQKRRECKREGHGRGFGFMLFCVIKRSTAVRGLSMRAIEVEATGGGHTSPNEPPTGLRVIYDTDFLRGLTLYAYNSLCR